MRLSAFQRHCRFLSVATLGAMLAFPANAHTSSESQSPSTGTSGSETQSKSPGSTPTPSTETSLSHRVRPVAPIRRSRRLIRHPKLPNHARQRFPIF